MSSRNKSLAQREAEFAERVNSGGKFEYISGYSNIKGNVNVLHKKCGHETVMRAYAVAYSDLDKCHDCGRQRREYRKCKEYIEELNPSIRVLSREKDDTGKNRYYVACRECGDVFSISYDTLKDGYFICCSEGVGAYERDSDYKVREIYNKVKKDIHNIEYAVLYDIVKEEVKKDTYLTVYKGLYDVEKLSRTITDAIFKRKEKDRVGICKCCNKVKTGVVGWGRRDANYSSKICLDCAKLPRTCTVCGKEKRTNTFATGEDGAYLDVCASCSGQRKNKPSAYQ